MQDWIAFDEKTDWQHLPNKYEILYQDGKINKIIIYGRAEDGNLIITGEGRGAATHWRPIKND